MTAGAALGGLDLPVVDELLGVREFALGGERLGIEIKDILRVADALLRIAMAIQAPGHTLWLMLVNDLHFIHRAMAAVATDATIHMN